MPAWFARQEEWKTQVFVNFQMLTRMVLGQQNSLDALEQFAPLSGAEGRCADLSQTGLYMETRAG